MKAPKYYRDHQRVETLLQLTQNACWPQVRNKPIAKEVKSALIGLKHAARVIPGLDPQFGSHLAPRDPLPAIFHGTGL